MKVFISSVIHGLEPYREAANRAARALRHEVKRVEDFLEIWLASHDMKSNRWNTAIYTQLTTPIL